MTCDKQEHRHQAEYSEQGFLQFLPSGPFPHLPEIPYALDTHYPWQSDEVIEGGRTKFEDGAVAVSSGPGLGVEIDRVALERLHQNYLDCGLTKRDDLVEMRKVIPDWEFKKVRW